MARGQDFPRAAVEKLAELTARELIPAQLAYVFPNPRQVYFHGAFEDVARAIATFSRLVAEMDS